jgi:hypothetical protein
MEMKRQRYQMEGTGHSVLGRLSFEGLLVRRRAESLVLARAPRVHRAGTGAQGLPQCSG